jgi:DNA (cytosine-5)-methyltransferase 1
VLSLFAGIGGFDLGLERTGGFKTVAFCEIDPFCRRVLAKHWPDVPCFEDVRKLRGEDVGAIDVICGGFPCQDISTAGKGAGLAGERSGLWREYARLIGEIRPLLILVENVAALLGRGVDIVLGDLASRGYDAWWDCIRALDIGAPHLRDRVWIVAYPRSEQYEGFGDALGRSVAARLSQAAVANSDIERSEGCRIPEASERFTRSDFERCSSSERRGAVRPSGWWAIEPDVGRVAHGVPKRVDRLRALGNAVVPQIPELIGHAILQARAA